MRFIPLKVSLQALTLLLVLALLTPQNASAQWNPRPNWKDSYAVGGKCYCDSNGYDHGLDTKSAPTPIGPQNVVDICNAIERVLGKGPETGRIPYNDIQCGNGPANDAADETGCPGRVDIGPAGCNQIGPKWDLDTVYANLPEDEQGLDDTNWQITASHRNSDTDLMIDDSLNTRWSTGTPQAPGQFIIIDFGGPLNFNRIVLDAYSNSEDYPRDYAVFVSQDGNSWGQAITTGSGASAVTSIEFTDQSAQYVRIEQTGSSSNRWWSIHQLKIFDDEQSEPGEPTTPGTPRPANAKVHMAPIHELILDDSDTNSETSE